MEKYDEAQCILNEIDKLVSLFLQSYVAIVVGDRANWKIIRNDTKETFQIAGIEDTADTLFAHDRVGNRDMY